MASGMYNILKSDLFSGHLDLSNGGDTIKVMLLDNSHVFAAADDVKGDIVANELAAAGNYVAGGETLANQAVTKAATTKWDGDDVEWTAATFSAWHAVIYDSTVTDNLIASIDFGGEKAVAAGTFTIQWHVNGIITLASA